MINEKYACLLVGLSVMLAIFMPGTLACSNLCTFGDIKCMEDSFTMSLCTDDNMDGCTEWSRKVVYHCPLGCMKNVWIENENRWEIVQDVQKCFPSHPQRNCDVCNFGETVCSLDGKKVVLCHDIDGDGCRGYAGYNSDYSIDCKFGCNYIFSPGVVEHGEGADCNPGPDYCPGDCPEGKVMCGSDGYTYVTCVRNETTGCNFWSDTVGYCSYGCQSGLETGTFCKPYPEKNYTIDLSSDIIYAYYSFDNKSTQDESKFNKTLSVFQPSSQSFVEDTFLGKWAFNLTDNLYAVIYNNYIPPEGAASFWFKYNGKSDENTSVYFWLQKTYAGYGQNIFLVKVKRGEVGFYIGNYTGSYDKKINLPPMFYGEWHKVTVQWSETVSVLIDGIYYTGVLETPEYMKNMLKDTYTSSSINLYSSSKKDMGYFAIDDYTIFDGQLREQRGCTDVCKYGERKCAGTQYAAYSLFCMDSDMDGCTDWKSNSIPCPNGCNSVSGMCIKEGGKYSQCDIGDYKCDDTSREKNVYSVPCGDTNSDGFGDWDYMSSVVCKFGCSESTGRCNKPRDICKYGETKCCGDYIADEFEGLEIGKGKLLGICNCTDSDQDGYYDWGRSPIQICDMGICQEDNHVGNGTNYAWCEYYDFDAIALKNAVDYTGAVINVAISNAFYRNVVSFMFSAIFAGLVFFVSRKNVPLSLISGLSVLSIFIYFGWVDIMISIGMFGISSYLIFKSFISGGDA